MALVDKKKSLVYSLCQPPLGPYVELHLQAKLYGFTGGSTAGDHNVIKMTQTK